MEVISLEAAQQADFEPLEYVQSHRLGRMMARVDFVGDMGGGEIALFFREKTGGERLYAMFNLYIPSGASEKDKTDAIITDLQFDSICDIYNIHAEHRLGIREISIVEQQPLCVWREKCDQRSPCCVFKS